MILTDAPQRHYAASCAACEPIIPTSCVLPLPALAHCPCTAHSHHVYIRGPCIMSLPVLVLPAADVYTATEAARVFKEVDTDKSGAVSYDEFKSW